MQPSAVKYAAQRVMKSPSVISSGTLPRRASSTRTVAPSPDRSVIASTFQTP